ncbi:MAG: WD40 repeat domain-containing protein [Syntrophobacteraceae bacterium]
MRTKICLLLIFGFLSCVFPKAEAAITWTTDNFDYKATDAAGYYYNWMSGVVCLNAFSEKSTANKDTENTDVATAVEPQPGSWTVTPGLSMVSAAWGNATQDLTKDAGGASVYAYANSAYQLDNGPGVLLNGQNVSSYIDRYFQVDANKTYTLSASALAPVSWSGTVSGKATAPQPTLTGWVKLLQTDQTTGATTTVQSFSLSDLLGSSRQASVSLVQGDLYQLVVSLSNVSDLGGPTPPAGIVTAFNNIDYSGGGSLGNIDGAFNAGTQTNPITLTASLSPAEEKGSLTVTIGPTAVVSAGARWNVDGGTWEVSGATVNGLSAGSHTVNFADVKGWTTPAPRIVTVSGNQTATASGTYVQSKSSTTNKLLWVGTNGSASIWTLDGSNNYVSSVGFGPYSGWKPLSYIQAPDGTARLLWANTNGSASIWTLDGSNNYVRSVGFGPYSGWTPVSYGLAPDGTARLLWANTNGAASIWKMDSSNNYVSSVGFGPYSGWKPLNCVLAPDGTARLLWANTNGSASIWALDGSSNYVSSAGFGPYSGWKPLNCVLASDGTARLLWANTNGATCIWTLDSSNNYLSSVGFGPFSGWTPLSYIRTSNGAAKLLWANTDGSASIWTLNSSNNYVSSVGFGPYSGWKPLSCQ